MKKEAGLYIHVPFCLKKCNYCDFVSFPYNEETAQGYVEGILQEMDIWSNFHMPDDLQVTTVFVGGGTPTCLSAGDLEKILLNSTKKFNIAPNAEITIEANPGTIETEKLRMLKMAGVNRLSLGIQSCGEDELSLLGRLHSFEEAEKSFYMATEAGFQNINVDLIFGIPGQTTEKWLKCLEEVLSLDPAHVSAYGLQIEQDTPLYRSVQRDHICPCGEEEELEMFTETIYLLKSHGYEHYEISNYARPYKKCRHNLNYWNNGEYIGLGPAAHSHMGGIRFSNQEDLGAYLKALSSLSLPVKMREIIDRETEMAETIFLGLRLLDGLNLESFFKRFGVSLEEVCSSQLARLLDAKLVVIENNYLKLTEIGLPVANIVFTEFMP